MSAATPPWYRNEENHEHGNTATKHHRALGALVLLGCLSSNTRRWSTRASSPRKTDLTYRGLLVAKMKKTSTAVGPSRPVFPGRDSSSAWSATKAGMPKRKPVRIPSRTSEPEPDVAVARGDIRDYEQQHPNAEDIALVVEVSDSQPGTRPKAGGNLRSRRYPGLLDHQHPRPPARSLLVARERRLLGPPVLLETESVDLSHRGRILGRSAWPSSPETLNQIEPHAYPLSGKWSGHTTMHPACAKRVAPTRGMYHRKLTHTFSILLMLPML